MKKSLQLTQHQRLAQRLAPAQVQFGRMLEMNAPEVEDEIRRTVDENPALEIAEPSLPESENQPTDPQQETAEQMQAADYRDPDDIPFYRLNANNFSPDDNHFEPVAVSRSGSLIDYMMEQVAETPLQGDDVEIARHIVGNLDSNGYLTRDIPAIADDLAFEGFVNVDTQRVKQVWEVVRSLDPPGIAAVDLRDALLLQLRRKPASKATDLAIEVVSHYFDLFSMRHFDRLMSTMGISTEQLREASAVIRQLNPKPGSSVESADDDKTRQIVPEFNVEINGGNLHLTLVNSLPELQISHEFTPEGAARLHSGAATSRQSEADLFIKQKRDEANNFIRILRTRQETLFGVMSAILTLQREFFLTGDTLRLRPMILKDIASLTGYDLSVISRATAGKYVATQFGTFPLKLFFNERPKDDNETSSHQIAAAIAAAIESENKRHPLSDDAIAEQLRNQGFEIARRTVAKYREKIGLPVARLRKEL